MTTNRSKLVFKSVKNLYESSERELGKWMWKNHVQWVADKAELLAEKYSANKESVYVGSLLHDLGDVWMERENEDFEKKSNEFSTKILIDAGFKSDEIKDILTNIIEPHSCYPDNLPQSIEGKCLASADAMFHLMTDFFPQFSWKHIPKKNYDEWIDWVNEKLERDYNNKIFFDSEKEEVEPYFLALKKVYTRV